MNNFFRQKTRRIPARNIGKLTALLLLPATLAALASCSGKTDYSEYVSELRSNVLTCEYNNLSLRVYATEKETPYAADGYCRETTPRAEIWLTAPTGIDSYEISFLYDGREYGGDMSFDNVKTEYYYSCTLDISEAAQIDFTVSWEDGSAELSAASVRTEDMLSPKQILEKVRTAESEKFSSMTDRNGFRGEIYMRLIYEDAPYYYLGIIDRDGGILALLVDSKDGKILARREM